MSYILIQTKTTHLHHPADNVSQLPGTYLDKSYIIIYLITTLESNLTFSAGKMLVKVDVYSLTSPLDNLILVNCGEVVSSAVFRMCFGGSFVECRFLAISINVNFILRLYNHLWTACISMFTLYV